MTKYNLMKEFTECKYDHTNLTNWWAIKREEYKQLPVDQAFENIQQFISDFAPKSSDNSPQSNYMLANGVLFNGDFGYTRNINPELVAQEAAKGKEFKPTPDMLDLAADAIERGGPKAAKLGLNLMKSLIVAADSSWKASDTGAFVERLTDFGGLMVALNPDMRDDFVNELQNNKAKLLQLDHRCKSPADQLDAKANKAAMLWLNNTKKPKPFTP